MNLLFGFFGEGDQPGIFGSRAALSEISTSSSKLNNIMCIK